MRGARTATRALSADLDRALLELAALPLGEPAPDAEPFIVAESGVQTLGPDLARQADLLGLPGGTALLREERLGVRLCTQSTLLPARFIYVPVEEKEFSHVTGLRPLVSMAVAVDLDPADRPQIPVPRFVECVELDPARPACRVDFWLKS